MDMWRWEWGLGWGRVGGSEGPEMRKGRLRNSFGPLLVKGNCCCRSRRIFFSEAPKVVQNLENFFLSNQEFFSTPPPPWQGCGGIRSDVRGCGGVWRDVEGCGGVWRNVDECGGVVE